MNRLQIDTRIRLLELYHAAGCGHIGCSLSCIDIILATMSAKDEGERIVLSKGHAAAALYTVLNMNGEIGDEAISTYYKDGTKLAAHPSARSFKNIPFGLGSLGHGLPIACGISLSNRIKGRPETTYVLMSDGETNEGTTWEAGHFAVKHGLDNLTVLIDRNGLQGFGKTEEVLGDTADPAKWESIGFDVSTVDGHDLDSLSIKIGEIRLKRDGKPKVVVCNTTKGKGVPYMENRLEWHYLPMSEEHFSEAVGYLKSQLK